MGSSLNFESYSWTYDKRSPRNGNSKCFHCHKYGIEWSGVAHASSGNDLIGMYTVHTYCCRFCFATAITTAMGGAVHTT